MSDNPISISPEDLLNRNALAESFAKYVLTLDYSDGIVVGILGPWGSGKTSFANLATPYFVAQEATILSFNPWMLSGADQLVRSFLREIAAELQLKSGLEEIGKDLEELGELFSGLTWLPFAGSWFDRSRRVLKFTSHIVNRRQGSIGAAREKVSKALVTLDKPIIVVVDDIDRLDTDEIRDIFKLVRLTASFPNIIYVVVFDRSRVESALTIAGHPGRDYLEKILQYSINIPSVPRDVMISNITYALNEALNDIPSPGPFDSVLWPDVLMEVVYPLIKNMRDIRRYSTAVRGAVFSFEGSIALVDLFALEAVRLFLPDVFDALYQSIPGLTLTNDAPISIGHTQDTLTDQINKLLLIGDNHRDVVHGLIHRSFPAAGTRIGETGHGDDFKQIWLREKRVAHELVLHLYLEQASTDELRAFDIAESSFLLMEDATEFSAALSQVVPQRLQDVISSLEAFQDDFSVSAIVPASIVLLNLLPVIPEKPGTFTVLPFIAVSRVVLRLLRKAPDQQHVDQDVRTIFAGLQSLTSQLALLDLVRPESENGTGIASETAVADLNSIWLAAVRGNDEQSLLKETDLFRVLLKAKKMSPALGEGYRIPQSAEMTINILAGARTRTSRQVFGDRGIREDDQLFWEDLIAVFGGETELRYAIEIARNSSTADESLSSLFELADRYLRGERPGTFGQWTS